MSDLSSYEAFLARVMEWDRSPSPSEATKLLAAWRELPQLKGKVDAEGIVLVRRYRAWLEEPAKLEKKLLETVGAVSKTEAALRGLVASAPGVPWPWRSTSLAASLGALQREPEPAKRQAQSHSLCELAAAVARGQGTDAAEALAWLNLMFHRKERDFWVPAALSIARLLHTAPPEGPALIRSWLAGSAAPTKEALPELVKRHWMTLGLLRAARGGREEVAPWKKAVETNVHDLTAAMDGLLSAAEGDPSVAEVCCRAVHDLLGVARDRFWKTLGYQTWDTARDLVERFPGEWPHAWDLLLSHAPRLAEISADGWCQNLYDAGVTLRWLEHADVSDRENRIQQLLAERLAGRTILTEALRPASRNWPQQVERCLALVAPESRDACPQEDRLEALVSLLVLVSSDQVAGLDWPKVLARGGSGWMKPLPGTVGSVAWLDLVRLGIDGDSVVFQQLLHQRTTATAANETSLLGLQQLIQSRWIPDSTRDAWKVHDQITQQAANHLMSHLLCASAVEDHGRILLAALSIDSPPANCKAALSGVEDEFWQYVQKWWPRGVSDWEATGAVIDCLAEWEKGRATEDPVRLLERGDALMRNLAERFPGIAEYQVADAEVSRRLRSAWAGRPRWDHAAKGWVVGAPSSRPATAVAMKDYLEQVADLHGAIMDGTRALTTVLGTQPPDAASGAESHRFEPLLDLEEVRVDVPLIHPDSAPQWTRAIAELRAAAIPLPWHTEGATDEVAAALEAWVSVAQENHARREERLRQLRDKMAEGGQQEDTVLKIATEQQSLLGTVVLREIGFYYLRRIDFGRARSIRQRVHGVPNALAYFAPLLFGIIGAPLSGIQTDKIWSPLLEDVAAGHLLGQIHYWLVAVGMLSFSIYLLYADIHKVARDLTLWQVARRGALPLAAILTLNYSVNGFVYWAVAREAAIESGPVLATFLWGSLSLFFGVFLGLIAQGRGVTEATHEVT